MTPPNEKKPCCTQCSSDPYGVKYSYQERCHDKSCPCHLPPQEKKCECGCHTSPHSDADMKLRGCDYCYRVYDHSSQEQTEKKKCSCDGPYTCLLHGGIWGYCANPECLCHFKEQADEEELDAALELVDSKVGGAARALGGEKKAYETGYTEVRIGPKITWEEKPVHGNEEVCTKPAIQSNKSGNTEPEEKNFRARKIEEFRLLWGIAPPDSLKGKKGAEIESFLSSALGAAIREGENRADWMGETLESARKSERTRIEKLVEKMKCENPTPKGEEYNAVIYEVLEAIVEESKGV